MTVPAIPCPYDPTNDQGGMFHCPLCGEMILAGIPHVLPLTDEDMAQLAKLEEAWLLLPKEDNTELPF